MALRGIAAALIDSAAVAAVSYLAFRLGLSAASCSDLGSCPQLTPLIVLAVLLMLGLYFGVGRAVWRRTPGQRLFNVQRSREGPDD